MQKKKKHLNAYIEKRGPSLRHREYHKSLEMV